MYKLNLLHVIDLHYKQFKTLAELTSALRHDKKDMKSAVRLCLEIIFTTQQDKMKLINPSQIYVEMPGLGCV